MLGLIVPRQLRGSRTKAELSRDTKSFDDTGIFVGPQVLFVHMKPTHEAQNPMVYGTHRRTPFTNNTMSQAYAVPEITATRRGTSGRTSSRCSTRSARCVLLQQRMLQAPTHTNRQGCERADAGKDWSTRVAGRLVAVMGITVPSEPAWGTGHPARSGPTSKASRQPTAGDQR